MPEWNRTTVGEVITLQRGFDITKSQQNPGDVPVVSSGGIGSYHDTAMVKGPGVVMGRKGTLGKVFYLEGDYWPHDTTLWVKDFKGNDRRFVYYFLGTLDFLSMDVGTSNPTLNRNHVHPVPIDWPLLKEQEGIAAVLGALDDKIDVNERIATTVDELASTTYLHSVVNSRIPEEVLLGEVAAVNVETLKPSKEGNIRYIDISSVGVGSYEWPDMIPWSDAPGRARRKAKFGSTIWSTVRPNRRSHALVMDEDSDLVFSTGLAVLTPLTVGPATFYEATSTAEFQTYLEGVAEGSAYPAVRAERFKEAPLLLPDAAMRDAFERTAMPMRRRAHQATLESRTLAALRDTLLPQLMSGRLRVKDAEKIVEEAT